MQVGGSTFPDEVVFVAKFGDGVRSDTFEETGVNRLMVRLGPAAYVLQCLPVFLTHFRLSIQPSCGVGNVVSYAGTVFHGGDVTSFKQFRSEPSRPVVGDKNSERDAVLFLQC